MARGKWTTSYRDKGRAQYQADQLAAALATQQQPQPANKEQLQQAFNDGWRAGWAAHQAAMQQQAQYPQPPHGQR